MDTVFLGDKDNDQLNIKIRLGNLIAQELAQPTADSARRDILTEIHQVLNSDKTTNNISERENFKFSISPQELHWLEKHDQTKWIEYIIYRYKFKIFPSQRKLLDFPLYLLIEPTSVCNLNCVMCFQADKTFRTKEFMGMMDWELFKKIADEAKQNNCHAITLASRGEPTLHPDFGRMLKYLFDLGILDVKINTNATRLTDSIIHDILAAQVSECVFSVDAATKETYEEIRVGGKFEEVVANVKRFKEIREKHYPNSPTVTRIAGVKIRPDQDEKQMSEFWSALVDEVVIKSAAPRWDTYNNEAVGLTDPCSRLWRQMYVWYDGKVNPCDFDYKSYLSVGDVNNNSIKEIWLGEKFSQLRHDHLNQARNKYVPCDRCPLV